MASEPTTVTITGAGGQIGYALLFRIAAGDMLGPDRPVRLRLLEIPQGMRAAEGAALELQDCAFPLLRDVEVTDDPLVAFDGCSIALLVGARPRGRAWSAPTCSRRTPASSAPRARRSARRPPTTCAWSWWATPPTRTRSSPRHPLPDVPADRFTALTRLDHNRAVGQLAETLQRRCRTICAGVTIWGNHSATQFPDVVARDRAPTADAGARCARRAAGRTARRRPHGSTTSSSPASRGAAPRSSRCAARRRWPRPRTPRSSTCATSSAAPARAGPRRRSSRAASTASRRASSARSPWSRDGTGYRVVEGLTLDDRARRPARRIGRGARRRARRRARARDPLTLGGRDAVVVILAIVVIARDDGRRAEARTSPDR